MTQTAATATIQTATTIAQNLIAKGATPEAAIRVAADALINRMIAERPELAAKLFAEITRGRD